MAVDFRALLVRNERGFFRHIPIGETGYKLSIQGSRFHYSEPRACVSPEEYKAWEVGLIMPNGELIGGLTHEQPPSWWPAGNDVWGYATTDEINELIERVLGATDELR